METTHFSQVDWIVAWDPQHQGHCYLKGGDLVFCGNEITFVGQGYDGPADRVVVGAGLCLIPGFVNIHSHPASEVFFRGIREDHSVPEHHMTGLYERSCAYGVEPEALRFGQVASYCELLRSGVTTLVDISVAFPGWTEVMAQSGIRGYAAPGFGTSRWRLENRHQLKFIQDEACGRSAFEATLELIDGLCDHPSGRLSGVVSPMQIETARPSSWWRAPQRPATAACLDPARLPGGPGVQRDRRSPRRHADPVARPAGRARRPGHPRPCHLHRQPLLDPLAQPPRPRPAGRERDLGGALPHPLHALRRGAGGFQRLPGRRHQPGHRHRHHASQHAGGYARGLRSRAGRQPERHRRHHRRSLSCRHPGRGQGFGPRGSRPPGPGGQGGLRGDRSGPSPDDATCAIRCAAWSTPPPSGPCATSTSTAARW